MASSRIKRSDILLGIVVLVAVVMSVTLFLAQLPGSGTIPNGPNGSSLQITDLAKNVDSGTLIMYVENVGTETVTIDSGYVVTVNGIEIPLFEGSFDKNVLEQGEIASVDVPFKITSGIPIVVRILSDDNILSERTINDPESLQKAYTLMVNIQGDGGHKVTKIPDQSSYPSGMTVTLTAEAVEEYVFSEWSGDVSSSENPLLVVVDSDKIIAATFVEEFIPVQVRFTQTGLDSSASGTILTVENTAKTISDFPITLIFNKDSLLNYDFATSLGSSTSGVRFKLNSVSGSDSPLSLSSDITIQASFGKEVEMRFSSIPEEADANTQPSGTRWYDAGQQVSISTENSNPRFIFSQWQSSNQANSIANSNSQNTNVVVNGPGTIIANYGITQFQISFGQNGITNENYSATVNYIIDGGTPIENTVPFVVMVDQDSVIEYSYQQDIFGDPGSRYHLDNVNQNLTLTITEPVDIIGEYNLQFFFTFDQSGLDSSSIGTIVTIGEITRSYSGLPYSSWFDSGTSYSFSQNVNGGFFTRFVLVNPSGTFEITSAGSVSGVYKTQFFFEVKSPEGLDASGEGWYDYGDTVTSAVNSPVTISGPPEIEYTSLGYDGTGSLSDGDETSVEFVIDESSTITWRWGGTMILQPNGIVDQNIPYSSGSDDHVECVTDKEIPSNKYVYLENASSNSDWIIDIYSLQNVGSISGSIDSVSVFTTCTSSLRRADARMYYRLDGVVNQGSQNRLTDRWIDYSEIQTSKPGGGSWTWVDINNLQCGIGFQLNDSDEIAYCTQLWVEIEFTV